MITALIGVYPPELDKALAESQKLLADPKLSEDARGAAQLEQAQILFRLDRMKECAALLDKAPTIRCFAATSPCFAVSSRSARARP